MGFGCWYNLQKVSVQAAVVSGVVVIVGGVVAGIFGIVDVELAKPSPQASTSVPATLTVSVSAPVTSASVGPTATSPSGIEITVTARRILGAAEGDEFGVACRADGEGYAFIVQSDLAEIIKYSSSTGQIGRSLARVPPQST